MEQGSLNDLLPEIYPIIAAHLPLHATPSTLLSLGLTNHHISEIALPLIHSRLILKREEDALLLLQKIATDPSLGTLVREIHVMSNLSREMRVRDPPSDVIRRVSDVILKGFLPFIHTLGLHLGDGWYYDGHNQFKGFGRLEEEFWSRIEEKCPKLAALILDGFMDDPDEPWMEASGIFCVPGITSFSIRIDRCAIQPSTRQKILRHVSSLAPALHTLDLQASCSEYAPASSILELDFPCLQSLSLGQFSGVNTSQAMAFWERHPSIVYLNVAADIVQGDGQWFGAVLPDKILEKLLYLKVHWNDALRLAPILGQLLSLSIDGSVNAQIPYLLRSVCPNGLPKLKSLDIHQVSHPSMKNKNIEGSLWYETRDGEFQRGTNKSCRTVFDGFMHSIVRGAPNLEELGFHGSTFRLAEFMSITDDLNGFTHLKHLYYNEYDFGEESDPSRDRLEIFASQARNLAEAVAGLVTITNVSFMTHPYKTVARITRGDNEQVVSVEVGNGRGMKIGHEDQAFP